MSDYVSVVIVVDLSDTTEAAMLEALGEAGAVNPVFLGALGMVTCAIPAGAEERIQAMPFVTALRREGTVRLP